MSVSVVGIVGAGFMGSGIAESTAGAGKHGLLYEPTKQPVLRSREKLAVTLDEAVSRGRLSRDAAVDLSNRVIYTTRFEDLRGADAVIEAVSENAQLKGELFARLDDTLPDAKFLASNTSSIPISELAARTRRPERVLGLHFFSPVPGHEAGRGRDRA